MYKALIEKMEKKHIKTFSLAKMADINPSDLYSAMKGNRPMFPRWRKRISEALNVPEEQLFDDKEGEKA